MIGHTRRMAGVKNVAVACYRSVADVSSSRLLQKLMYSRGTPVASVSVTKPRTARALLGDGGHGAPQIDGACPVDLGVRHAQAMDTLLSRHADIAEKTRRTKSEAASTAPSRAASD